MCWTPTLIIVQECGPDSPSIAEKQGWTALWTGEGSKGLGLFARPPWRLEGLSHEGHWWLPARVRGQVEFTLVRFWALPPAMAHLSYTRQATVTATELAGIVGRVVVGGDSRTYKVALGHASASSELAGRSNFA